MSELKWRTVQIPSELIDLVEKRLRKKGNTHHTISGFVVYSIRKELDFVEGN